MKKKNGDIKKIFDKENKVYFIKRLYELIEHGYMLEDSLEFLLIQYDVPAVEIEKIKSKLSNGDKLSDILGYMFYIAKYKPILFLNTLLIIPKVKNYAKLYFSYRFAMELSLFLMSGFSLKTALEVMIEEKYDYYLTCFSEEILTKLDLGITFEDAIGEVKFFDKSMKKFIIHGKNNGLIDKELKLFSELMLDTFLTSLDRSLRKIQPILFGVLALVIVGLYMVILLPIFNMASSLK